MKKALIVATVYNFISSFERSDIRILQEQGYEVWCACNTDEADGRLDEMGVHVVHIPFARSPFSKSNLSAYKQLVKLMRQERFDLMHCHTPVGGVLGRLAAGKCRLPRVIYTAHGFHFYTGAPKLNWLLYYPIEKWLARKTDILITINQEDYQRACKQFKAKRVEYVPGVGVDLEGIQSVVQSTDRKAKREEIGIREDEFLVLSVGELNENKNHQVVIRALAELNDTNFQYVICGKGVLAQELQQLAESLGIGNRVKLLGHRKDVIEIMACADLFVHPSYREGLPVSVMEAMAAGLPVIGSRIRGIVDLLDQDKECLFTPYKMDDVEDKVKKSMDMSNSHRKSNLSRINNYAKSVVQEKMTRVYRDCEIVGGKWQE